MTHLDDALLLARIIAKTNEYLDFPSVVGHETPFLDHIVQDFEGLGLSARRYRNLAIVDAGSDGPIFCAHVDRHGGVVDHDGRVRYAAFAVKSEKYGDDVAASPAFVDTLSKRYAGEEMFAYDRETGGRLAYARVERIVHDAPTGRALFDFDAMPALPQGAPVAFSRTVQSDLAGDEISGQLDNPLSAALLRVAAEFGLRGTLVFAAEEEIGRSAAHILGWLAQALGKRRDLVVVDTSPFDTGETAQAGTMILRRKDAHGDFANAMTDRIESAARASGAPVLFKDAYVEEMNVREGTRKSLGMTELGRIVRLSGGEITGSTLQIPTWNYHTNRETTCRAAVLNAARTLLAL